MCCFHSAESESTFSQTSTSKCGSTIDSEATSKKMLQQQLLLFHILTRRKLFKWMKTYNIT